MKTLKYKFYNNEKNKFLNHQIDIAGQVWNFCVALQRRYYKLTGKYIHHVKLKNHLVKVKKRSRFQHWNTLGSQAIQDVVERLDRSYKAFFNSRKSKDGNRKVGRPGFRKIKRYSSFTLKQAGWKLTGGNRIKIGKRSYRFSLSRNIIGTVKTVIIKRTKLGEFFLYFVVENSNVNNIGVHSDRSGKNAVGIDFGLRTFLTIASEEILDGSSIVNIEKVKSPQWFKQNLKDIHQANKILSRKKKGSVKRKQALKHLQRIHEKVENRRNDWLFKFANKLAIEFDTFFFETLNLKGMQKMWGRKVSDIAFGKFLFIFQHIAQKHGKIVDFIDKFFPSSKLCSCCGYINKDLCLKDETWFCSVCKTNHDRDINAALNILREGLSKHVGASTCGLASVRPGQLGLACLNPGIIVLSGGEYVKYG